ncbi:hypothetical protein NUACC21_47480 [Scytonema sp. NUACC21]
MKQVSKILGTTLAISLCFTGVSEARTITSISPPTGMGLGDVLCSQVQTPVATPFINNDNSTDASQNQIPNFPGLSCTPVTFQTTEPVDTQLFVESSGGTTEYFFTQTIVNNTDSTWNGFNFRIGFGVNDNFGSPELILVPPGFAIPSFDSNSSNADPKPTSSKFTQLTQDGSFNLSWSGGSVAPGESVTFTFSVDVPDDLDGNNFYQSFTIRQAPTIQTVSEPSYPLSFLGLLGLLGSSLTVNTKDFDTLR